MIQTSWGKKKVQLAALLCVCPEETAELTPSQPHVGHWDTQIDESENSLGQDSRPWVGGEGKRGGKGRTIYMHTWLRVSQSPECARQETLPSTCGPSPGTGSDLHGGVPSAQLRLWSPEQKHQPKNQGTKMISMRGVLEQPRHKGTAVRTS